MIQRVVIDVDAREGRRASRCRPTSTARRSAITSPAGGEWADVQWSPDGSQRRVRLDARATTRTAKLRVADAATGEVRDVLEETVATFFESGNGARELALPAGVERGDLVLGARQLGPALPLRSADRQAKHQITTGEGNVTQLLRVDEKTRTIYFSASARRRDAIRTSRTSTASASTART